jgi:hypothetical protein
MLGEFDKETADILSAGVSKVLKSGVLKKYLLSDDPELSPRKKAASLISQARGLMFDELFKLFEARMAEKAKASGLKDVYEGLVSGGKGKTGGKPVEVNEIQKLENEILSGNGSRSMSREYLAKRFDIDNLIDSALDDPKT